MPYEDVLDAIEQVRLSKWKERHVRISTGHTLTRRLAGVPGSSSSGGGLVSSSVMPTSHSQPLYVPGKYLPSSCLSNREENEIYSYTQNDLANRMARNAIDSKSALNLNGMQHSYPGARTNFFYDFSATGKGREGGGGGGGAGAGAGRGSCQRLETLRRLFGFYGF
ncbi:GL24336 [Drosophila persimilis]|uniref:GL24336 n=1 Tax=Drosophila persimilis TaxID=7234 RepID=B4G5B2_DROPE|nr:GL24336 [Drosophila persimilis]